VRERLHEFKVIDVILPSAFFCILCYHLIASLHLALYIHVSLIVKLKGFIIFGMLLRHHFLSVLFILILWLCGVMVTASDQRSKGRRFDSQPFQRYSHFTIG